jgi:hypothetical protein
MAGLFAGALVVACGGGGGGGTSAPTTSPTTTPANARVPAIPAAFDSINRAFDAQPPSATGPNSARDTAITQFDALLWATDATRTTPSEVIDYYQASMARVVTELAQPVTSGFRVWAMYNHGFIVKTASTTIAFDLVEGKSSFNGPAWTVQLPQALPVLAGVELLLLNGWINESGSASNLTDMKSSLDKLRPDVMVPGHFEELSHVASDANVTRDGRYRFLDALPLQNSALGRSKTVVLTWGERLDYGKSPCPTGQVRIYADCRLAGSVPPDAVLAVVNLSSQFPDRSSNASALPPFGLAMAPETATLWASRWAADAGPGAVLRFNANTGSYNCAFASPGAYPSEMSFDGNDL